MFDFIDPWLQHTWLVYILLIVGFVALVKGADWLVDGASGLAKRFHVSDLAIGLTVVAFGTSMPEFVVNMISAGEANSELAITNILGSNAINIFVILGLTAVICPVVSKPRSRKIDIPFACIGALLILFCAVYSFPHTWRLWEGIHFDGAEVISGKEGVLLFVIFIIYMIQLAKTSKENPDEVEEVKPMKLGMAILLILVGLLGLTFGGEFIVKSATRIAVNLGVSDAIIGLTIVALGTSLPELATSVIAAMKHNSDLAIGNCVGSCIFNIFFVLSLSSIVHPLAGYDGLLVDALFACAGPFLVWLFVFNGKQHRITRIEGALLLVIYAVYLIFRLFNLV